MNKFLGPFDVATPPRCARVFGLTTALWANRWITASNSDQEAVRLRHAFVVPTGNEARAETVGRAYDGAVTLVIRLEAKAIGLLQVIAIGFALVALVVDRDSWAITLLCLVAIAYLLAATSGAGCLLRASPQLQVQLDDSLLEDGGLLVMVLAARSLEESNPSRSNLVSGAIRGDVSVGFAAAVVALLLTVLGV